MGGSISKNVSRNTINAISSIATQIIANQSTVAGQSQILNIEDTDGSFIMSNNQFNQVANVNIENLVKSLLSQTAQQDISQKLQQIAKSITKGINLFQYSEADNILELYLNASISLSTIVSQTCSTSVSQNQKIQVRRTGKDVIVSNNVFTQVANILTKCTQDTINNSASMQKIEQWASQSATAKSIGINLMILIIMIIVIIGVLTGGVVVTESVLIKNIFKYIFYILFTIGIILLILYFTQLNKEVKLYGYSIGIDKDDTCIHTVENTQDNISMAQAIDICKKSTTIGGFDWTTTQTKFYTGDLSSCLSSINKSDDSKLTKETSPIVLNGTGDPVPNYGDTNNLYIDLNTSNIFRKSISGWTKLLTSPLLGSELNVRVGIGLPNNIPTTISYIDISDPKIYRIYKFTNGSWVKTQNIDGPGMIFSANIDKTKQNVIWSGIKINEKNPKFLTAGIGCIAGGLIGIIASIIIQKNIKEEQI